MRIFKEIGRQPAALFGLIVIALVILAALGAPLFAPFDPNEQMFDGLTLEGAPMPPGGPFVLGTDTLGRDLLSRMLFGARTSLIIGLVANGVAVSIGLLVGIMAGYLRGWAGNLIMRFTDLMMAFPALLLAIVIWRHPETEPVDRRAGHCARQLGSGRAHRLYRDPRAGGA